MARFAWVTLDDDALVVVVEAEDREAAKRKVVETMVAEYGDPDPGEDPPTAEEYLGEYGETWRVYGLSDSVVS